ncbi:hypothetical protein COB11_04430 [Candidatus Aerophobetes bacterium]|uniref:Uncharacterized protein n=1 Tax=Aerophobetes bacterium TaxID=2030807 RepID=A0A2A4YH62_UNCAE|nr:MAG: hypothetical protein COB11_04430 [Candidatus Aerophobetes bacterium]
MQGTNHISLSTVQEEGLLRASKHQRVQVLMEASELRELFFHLGDFYVVESAKVKDPEQQVITKEDYLKRYALYIDHLKTKLDSPEKDILSPLSVCFSKVLDCFYMIDVGNNKALIKQKAPSVFVQPFSFHYDSESASIFTGVHTKDRIFWGLEFSFPQMYQDPKTFDTIEILKDKQNPNTQLFKKLQSSLRKNTKPTSLNFSGVSKAFPFKLSQNSLAWVQDYPKLKQFNIQINS